MAHETSRARICKPFRSPGIDSQPGGPVRQPYLTYRTARLHWLAESNPWNQFPGSLNVYKCGHRLADLTKGLQLEKSLRVGGLT
jgi:hypothetical protein